MGNCAFCGEETTRPKFCGPECRREHNRTAIVGEKPCSSCGEMFGFTANTKYRATCRKAGCRSAGWRTRDPKADHKERPAPPQVREKYCVQYRDGSMVRCALHEETCSDGCYREMDGKPCCRVEPATQPRPPAYRQSTLSSVAVPRGVSCG